MNRALLAVLIAASFVFVMGCENESERLVRMARENADRQAGQNNEMSRLNREVAQSHSELVELQRDVEERAATVSDQRDLLEEERRQIAGERIRESILGPLIANLGPLLVCGLVLLFCSILLFGLRAERDGDDVVAEILIEELTSSAPKLIPPVADGLTAIEDDRQHLPGEVVSNSDLDDE
jgi:hypothetical protein